MVVVIKVWDRQPIIELWNKGYSAPRIIENLGLAISVRQVQRIGSEYGSRTLRASGRLEVGEWGSSFKFIVIALMEQRGDDPYTCALCGTTGIKRMTVHHLRYDGATLADLVFACMSCQNSAANKGLQ